MEAFSPAALTNILALVGAVIMVAALLSGLIERSGLPQVGIFLALGAALGPAGLGLINVQLDSPILRIVTTLSLVLVLFTDAVSLDVRAVRQHGVLALLALGPGTLFSAALIALAGWWLLGLSVPAATVLGAALASTDPVLLRGLLRRPHLPGAVRQVLRFESGMNDAVLLPVVIVAMAFMGSGSVAGGQDWVRLGVGLFLLGPAAGVAVGLLAVAALDLIRRRIGVRRDYESLYSLGVAFAAYAAAEVLQASGFLAAFTAGLTISALDVELCDCFLEYGETTAEMALLFTFVLLGAWLIWSGFAQLRATTLLFALAALLARPVAFLVSLIRTRLEWGNRLLIAWFGPRGLSSLLLILLSVFAGLPGSERLFGICCLVVLLSVVLHGGSLMALGRDARRAPDRGPAVTPAVPPTVPPSPVTAAGPPEVVGDAPAAVAPAAHDERLSVAEVGRLQARGEPVIVLDVRSDRSYDASPLRAPDAVRLHPDAAVVQASELHLPRHAWLVAFCA